MTYIPKSIFSKFSLKRAIKWESHLNTLTPWENHNGIWFKVEQEFAPLGPGGPNGSKLRQLIHYVSRNRGGKTRIVTGASLQSPQLSMTSIVGAHFGLPVTCVVYSKPETILGHLSPRIAAGFGATFVYAKGPYNPILQKGVADLAQDPQALVVHYGISIPTDIGSASEILKFHETGAHQVSNIPDQVKRLIIPAGSCNTLTSVLLGLIQDPHNVEEIYTIGIGPSKDRWLRERFEHMGIGLGDLPFKWRHFSLHDSGYSKYTDRFNGESWNGIPMHPVYEAKIARWLRENNPQTQDGSVGFWIVGGDTDPRVLEPFYTTPERMRG